MKIDSEEYNSVDEQIISSKTKYSSIRQYNSKKQKMWEFTNIVCAGIRKWLEKICRARWWKICSFTEMLTSCWEVKHKLFTSYWFTTLDLLHHFRSKGIHAVGTTRLNHLQDCPIDTNKDLMKNGRGTIYYRCDGNSDIMTVEWVDNSMVNISSDFAGVEPVGELERWHGKEKVRKTIPCPQIVQQCSKNMGGIDLRDMLLSLYRIPCKGKLWYQKIFWHLIDQCLDQRLMLGSFTFVTFVRMENHTRIKNLYSNPVLSYQRLLSLPTKRIYLVQEDEPQKKRSPEAPTTGK